MSNLAIKNALETFFNERFSDLPISWENHTFKPEADKPYQEVFFLFAEPDNPTMGDDFYRQRGIFQVTLRYPQNNGSRDAALRADAIRNTFHRGLSVAANDVTTIVDTTPQIGNGVNVENRYVVVVRVRFHADIFGS